MSTEREKRGASAAAKSKRVVFFAPMMKGVGKKLEIKVPDDVHNSGDKPFSLYVV